MIAAVVASRKLNLLRGLILADPTFLSVKVQREVGDSSVADKHRKMLNMSLGEVVAEAQTRHFNRSMETVELFAQARLKTSMAAFDVLTPPNPNYEQLVSKIQVQGFWYLMIKVWFHLLSPKDCNFLILNFKLNKFCKQVRRSI